MILKYWIICYGNLSTTLSLRGLELGLIVVEDFTALVDIDIDEGIAVVVLLLVLGTTQLELLDREIFAIFEVIIGILLFSLLI